MRHPPSITNNYKEAIMPDSVQNLTLGDPALNLQVVKQRTTVIVEPTSRAGGAYDSAEITTVFTLNNPQAEQSVEFILPYVTEQFSASMGVVSNGEQSFKNRLVRVGRVDGNLDRVKPYLRKIGYSEESFDTGKEIKAIAGQFRAGTLQIPTGQSIVKIQMSVVVNPVTKEDGSTVYVFKAYSPLPTLGLAGGRVPLTLATHFKGDEAIRPQITKYEVTNPYGDGAVNTPIQIIAQPFGEDVSFYWKWQSDPVVEFEYHY